ncbi:MAG TPA: GNAT family protein [Halanaerobiales bacterium]|nr:GNAT family protein [Halanaerobiales bacterium]
MARKYGKKIMLREYQENDLGHMMDWINDPNIVKFLSDRFLYPQSRSQVENFLNKTMDENWAGFVISDRETGDYLGQIDFVEIDEKNGCAEVALVIGDTNDASKGIGTEAMQLMMDFGFNNLRLNRIELSCWDYNERAINLYKKLGFTEEGRKRKNRFFDGEYHDEVFFGILREEWQELDDTV